MWRLVLLLSLLLPLGAADDRPRLRPIPAIDQNIQTGPAIGKRVPAFKAVDQHGMAQNFKSLRGPHGLALLFVRSADW